MTSINLFVLVILVALTFACESEIGQDDVSRAKTATPGQSATGEATTASVPVTAEPPVPPAATRASETLIVPSPSPTSRTPDASRTLVPSATGRVMISGVLAVAIGDPPEDSG